MDSNTSVAIMFLSAFGATSLIVNFLLNYRFKSKLLRSGLLDPDALKVISNVDSNSRHKVLKLILLLFFGGLGLIALQYTGYSLNEPLPYGVEALFLAAGLFTYYLLAYQKTNIQ